MPALLLNRVEQLQPGALLVATPRVCADGPEACWWAGTVALVLEGPAPLRGRTGGPGTTASVERSLSREWRGVVVNRALPFGEADAARQSLRVMDDEDDEEESRPPHAPLDLSRFWRVCAAEASET